MSTSLSRGFQDPNTRVPDLQVIAGIHSALQAGDDTALALIVERAANPTATQEHIFRSFSTSCHYVEMGNRPAVYWHSHLWMVPVLLPFSAQSIVQVPKQCSRWLQGWMGMQPNTLLERVLSVQDVLRLQPGQTRQLLNSLTGFGQSCSIVIRGDPILEDAPRLGFLMGAVKALHREPVIPANGFAQEARKIQRALEFSASGHSVADGPEIVVGGLQDFSGALVQGLQMWLHALHDRMGVDHWTMDLAGGGNLALSVAFEKRERASTVMTVPLRHWQMGHKGVENLLDFCKRWPMAAAIGQGGMEGMARTRVS